MYTTSIDQCNYYSFHLNIINKKRHTNFRNTIMNRSHVITRRYYLSSFGYYIYKNEIEIQKAFEVPFDGTINLVKTLNIHLCVVF